MLRLLLLNTRVVELFCLAAESALMKVSSVGWGRCAPLRSRLCRAPSQFVWALVVALALSVCVLAQSGAATVTGTVKDPTGAVIPGAKVTVLHVETGRANQIVANAEGYYSTPPVNIGRYKIRVEMQGMKSWEGEVILETGRTAVVDPVLNPGSVTETIEVTETIPLVSPTDPTDATTLDSERIKNLPINGRNLNTLLGSVTPGVEASEDVNGGVRISGLMGYSTDYVQDGAAANNREFGGSAGLQGLESIGEVRVETSTSSAKYTRPTSVIITTRGGTNRLTFALFETHRNNAFGVARARQDVFFDGRPYQTPKLIRNEFGGSVGGPVMLPTFGLNGKQFYSGKNRTFFRFVREGAEMVQGITREFRVPTAAMRNGDFSALIDAQGRRIQLYDPLTTRMEEFPNGRLVSVRDPFSNNQISPQRLSAFTKRIYDITPMPTDITNPVNANNLKIAVPLNNYPNMSDNPTTLRLDHQVTDNDSIIVKFNYSNRRALFLGTGGATGAPTKNWEANTTYLPMLSRSVSFSWVRTFGPAFNVETLVNRTWQISRTVTGVGAERLRGGVRAAESFGRDRLSVPAEHGLHELRRGRQPARVVLDDFERGAELQLHSQAAQLRVWIPVSSGEADAAAGSGDHFRRGVVQQFGDGAGVVNAGHDGESGHDAADGPRRRELLSRLCGAVSGGVEARTDARSGVQLGALLAGLVARESAIDVDSGNPMGHQSGVYRARQFAEFVRSGNEVADAA